MTTRPIHPSHGSLLDHHSGRLDEADRSNVDGHVQGCPSCRGTLDTLEWLDRELACWGVPEPPTDGLARVMARIEGQHPVASRLEWLAPATATLGAVVLGSVAIALAGPEIVHHTPLADSPLDRRPSLPGGPGSWPRRRCSASAHSSRWHSLRLSCWKCPSAESRLPSAKTRAHEASGEIMDSGIKKRLIVKLASLAGGTAFVAAMVALMAFVVSAKREDDAERNAKREESEARESAKKYLADAARRFVKLPPDPAVIGEIESKHFEEREKGPMYVWAMGTGGEFLFGVPSDAFTRLNTLFERQQEILRSSGLFASRQEFLRELIQSHQELSGGREGPFSVLAAEEGDVHDESLLEVEWQRFRDDDNRNFVFSVPMKGQDGTVLGTLYMKLVRGQRTHYSSGDLIPMHVGEVALGVLAPSLAFLWFLLPTWVYVDARERGLARPLVWAFLVLISAIVGLVIYRIARPEHTISLECPGCGREVNGGSFCPHCGRDVSAAFCPACRYPLKGDWAFCPSCRTEVKASAPQAATSGDFPSA